MTCPLQLEIQQTNKQGQVRFICNFTFYSTNTDTHLAAVKLTKQNALNVVMVSASLIEAGHLFQRRGERRISEYRDPRNYSTNLSLIHVCVSENLL